MLVHTIIFGLEHIILLFKLLNFIIMEELNAKARKCIQNYPDHPTHGCSHHQYDRQKASYLKTTQAAWQ